MRHFLRRLAFLLRLPWVGEIGGAPFGDPVEIDDPRFGRSSWIPSILEIHVDDEDHPGHDPHAELADVGHIVHERLFSGRPPFVFNVCFSCARANPFRPGLYCDPRSHWWNVFFGFYEIDVSKAAWGRPFAYRDDGAGGFTVDFEDIARIGKADWNYFSNYLYGVPREAIEPYDDVDMSRVVHEYRGRADIDGREFDEVIVDDVEVVSAYTGDVDALRWPSALFTPIYRILFGNPAPQAGDDRRFPSTRMKAHLFLAWGEGDDPDHEDKVYKTWIFGGTINKSAPVDPAFNEDFLAAQVRAVRRVIARRYDALGFPPS